MSELSGFGALSVSIGGDSTGFTAALKKSEADLKSWGQKLAGAASGFGSSIGDSFGKSLKSVFSLQGAIKSLVGLIGIGSIALLIKTSINTAAAINEMSNKAQMSTHDFQALMYVASQANLSIDGLQAGIKKLNQEMGQSMSGQTSIFSRLGIDIKSANGETKTQIELLDELRAKYQAASSAGERALIMQQAFGKAGNEWNEIMSLTDEEFKAQIADAERLGLILDDRLLKGADSAQDALSRLGKVLNTQLIRIILNLAPAIEDWAKAFADAAPQIQSVVDKIAAFVFGIKAMSIEGLRNEAVKVQQLMLDDERAFQRDMENLQANRSKAGAFKSMVDDRIADTQRRFDALKQMRMDELNRIEALIAQRESQASKPPPKGETTYGNLAGDSAEKLHEYMLKLRESITLAMQSADMREVLEAQFQAEQIAHRKLTISELNDIEQLIRARQGLVANQKLLTDAQEEGKRIMEEVRTPAEVYADTVQRLNFLLALGATSQEGYNRAIDLAKEKFRQTTPEGQRVEQAVNEIGSAFANTAEAALNMSGDISTVFEQFLKDIARVILQLYILGPLMESMGKMMKGLMNGESFSSLWNKAPGALNIIPNMGDTGWITDYLGLASGGSFQVGGAGGTDSQLTTIRTTPGEIVNVKRPGWDTANTTPVMVVVNNNSKASVKTQEGRDDQGNPSIEILIEEVVSRSIGRPGSRTNRAISDTFGTRNVLARR